jgi:hypothetical protein
LFYLEIISICCSISVCVIKFKIIQKKFKKFVNLKMGRTKGSKNKPKTAEKHLKRFVDLQLLKLKLSKHLKLNMMNGK